jgi:predicted protein tyrosine phosphatase
MFGNVEGLEVRSAGVSSGATVPVTRDLIGWADKIFVMEHKHEKAILKIDPSAWRKIEVLNIPDRFYRNQPELKALLKERMQPYLKRYKLLNKLR